MATLPLPFVNGVYYPCWRIYRGHPPSSLNLDHITHVYYAFIRLNENGTLRYLDEHADLAIPVDDTRGCLSAVAKFKSSCSNNTSKPKILLSIGGGSGSVEFPAVAANPSFRSNFATSCRTFVDRHGFDGVDIDWEHPQIPKDGENYIRLLQALRSSLPRGEGYLLTTALPVGEYCLKHIDLATAGNLLDYLNLMGYDFSGTWTDVSGHHAQLLPPPGKREDIYPTLRTSCHGGVEYVLSRGFPAKKIILGIPVYARSFEGAHGAGQPFKRGEEIDYCDLPREWAHQAMVDKSVGAAYFVDGQPSHMRRSGNGNQERERTGKGFISFDVPETVRFKADYVRRMGLGGLFYWTGVGDVREGPESLVVAGYRGLAGLS